MFLYRKNLSPSLLVFTLVASTAFSSQCSAAADRTLAEYAEIGTAVLRAPAKMAHTYAYATNDPRQKLAHVLSYTLCIVNDSLSVYNHRGSKSLYHEYTRLAHDLLSGAQAISSMLNNDVLIDGVSVEEQQRLTEISAALCYVLPLIESAGATYVATTNLGATPKEDVVKKHQLAAGLTSLAHYLSEYLKTNDNPMIGYARLALIAETTGLIAYQQLGSVEEEGKKPEKKKKSSEDTKQENFEARTESIEKTSSVQLQKFLSDARECEQLEKEVLDLTAEWGVAKDKWYEFFADDKNVKDLMDNFIDGDHIPYSDNVEQSGHLLRLRAILKPHYVSTNSKIAEEMVAQIKVTCELESRLMQQIHASATEPRFAYFLEIYRNEYRAFKNLAVNLLLQAQKA